MRSEASANVVLTPAKGRRHRVKLARNPLSARQLGKGAWSLADQSVVSLGNFLTQVVLARNLSPARYGVFALIYGVLIVLFTCQGSLVAYPLSIRGATVSHAYARQLAFGSISLSIMILPLQAAIVLATAWVIRAPQFALLAVLALAGWQIQETVRRGLMSELRHNHALWGDAVSYLGQAAVLWALAHSGRLTLASSFLALAATSAVAALIQSVQLGLTAIPFSRILNLAREYWPTGRWALFNSLSETGFRQAFPWALALFFGPQQAASFQAVINVLGVSHPVLYGATNLIVPAAAAKQHQSGSRAALRTCVEFGAMVMALAAPYFAALLFWPSALLSLLYGKASAYSGLLGEVRLAVVGYIFGIVGAMLTGYLLGVGRSKRAFAANVAALATAAIPSLILIPRFGVIGAVGSFVFWLCARMLWDAFLVRQTIHIRSEFPSVGGVSPIPVTAAETSCNSGVAK
jgi:O-antigen/teichoic acid export membrane protein